MFFCNNIDCSEFNNFLLQGQYCCHCGTLGNLVEKGEAMSYLQQVDLTIPNGLKKLSIFREPIDYASLDFEAEIDKLTAPDISEIDFIDNSECEEVSNNSMEVISDENPSHSSSLRSFNINDTMAFVDSHIEKRFSRKSHQTPNVNFGFNRELIAPKKTNNFTQVLTSGNIGLQMQYIPSGEYIMGNDNSDFLSELPTRLIQIPSFYVSNFLITQLQYHALTDINPAKFVNLSNPVETVSFFEAIEYCKILSRKTGKRFRLLSEAEWEYACRAGTSTNYSFGNIINTNLCCYSPISKNEKRQYGTVPVGLYNSNAFGLHDMHGNVWEWCADNWHRDYKDAPITHEAWMDTKELDISSRIIRGGAWNEPDSRCRSSFREKVQSDIRINSIGFRVACDL
jgi:formylglycine-generating enzyme required for sulfatase activity